MENLASMQSPSRADLEAAARTFFTHLAKEVDRPRDFPVGEVAQAVAYNVMLSQERIAELERQLVSNEFDGETRQLAEALSASLSVALPDLDDHSVLVAKQLAARVARQQMVYFIHLLTQPTRTFVPDDDVFGPVQGPRLEPTEPLGPLPAAPTAKHGPSLADLTATYLRKKELRGLGQSQIDETARLLGWLNEEIGGSIPVAAIARDALRSFRDNLMRIDVTLRGRAGKFRDRLGVTQIVWNDAPNASEPCSKLSSTAPSVRMAATVRTLPSCEQIVLWSSSGKPSRSEGGTSTKRTRAPSRIRLSRGEGVVIIEP
jgi:hypothetical protein